MPRLLIVLIVLGAAPLSGTGAEPMFRVQAAGETFEGTPLVTSDALVVLLGRDGQRRDVKPAEVSSFAAIGGSFRGFSAVDMRGQLQREFGAGFEVSGAGRFIVVHPAGQRDRWAPRFEELYRSFVHYFTARGWRPTEPRFPLVAVVYPRQSDFARKAAEEGVVAGNGLLGYYSPRTNRVLLYDSTQQTGGDWTLNAETIIHEAAHQAAFNCGVHSRFGQSPRWLVEGLGTMFEARGVSNSQKHPGLSERVNRGRLQQFRAQVVKRKAGTLAELVSSDRMFQSNVDAAYAESWALTFFLCETEPKKYVQYLTKTAAIEPFTPYKAPQRLADFTSIFGNDLKLLEAKMQRYIAGLK